MIGQRVEAVIAQRLGGLVDALAGRAIDDARLAAQIAREQREKLTTRLVLHHDRIADVGPVEARHELARILEGEPLADLLARLRIGGGGERDARHRREALVQDRQPEVLGPEVVPPLRHAMRLVDREERDAARFEQLETPIGEQPLGRDVEQIELAGPHRTLDPTHLVERQRGVQVLGPHAVLAQRVDLVLHQRDQRRHHDTGTLAHQRRHLIAQRLAGTGGHQHQRIAARAHLLDDRLLQAAEGGVAPDPAQHCERGGGRCGAGIECGTESGFVHPEMVRDAAMVSVRRTA